MNPNSKNTNEDRVIEELTPQELRQRQQVFEGATDHPRWYVRHEGILAVLVIPALIGLLAVGLHWARCLLAPVEIHPVEDTTLQIYFSRRHWFGPTEQITLHARRDENGDWKWMARSLKTGEWYSFFSFGDDYIDPDF